jgi:hypothetical protein
MKANRRLRIEVSEHGRENHEPGVGETSEPSPFSVELWMAISFSDP